LSAVRALAVAVRAFALLGLGAAFAGCLPASDFRCERHAQCGANALCEVDGRCSSLDPKCPSGRRYLSDEGGSSNACVGEACAENPLVGVAVGVEHACAWRKDHKVSCWGRNDSGQLGDHSHTPRSRDVPVIFPGAVSVAAGKAHTCAATPAGAVFCWGADDSGQLGDGGGAGRSLPAAVPGITTAVAVTAGDAFSCAVLSDTTVTCWGDNSLGQLGDGGAAAPNRRPTAVSGLSGVRALSATRQHACAIRADETLWCWGHNGTGQLGDGSLVDRPEPVQVQSLSAVTRVATGLLHTCAATRAEGLWCWGDNGVGQLGTGTAATLPTPSPSPVRLVSNPVAVAAGEAHTCAIRQGGAVLCWGANADGQLGEGSTSALPIPAPVAELGATADVVAGGSFSCALDGHGGVFCWGDDHFGQLGLGRVVSRAEPQPVPSVGFALDVAAGDAHTCVVTKGTPDSLSCWGANQAGQLGDATIVDRSTPAPVKGGFAAVSVAAGMAHTCAIDDGGALFCWGRGHSGQLGPNHMIDTPTPVEVPLGAGVARTVAAGDAHTCVALDDGTAACWGANADGQLGDGTTTDRAAPAPVGASGASLEMVDAITAGAGHTCAHLADGSLRCWGRNADGQLGDDSMMSRALPVGVTVGRKGKVAPPSFTSTSAGAAHTCAIDGVGTLWCWGRAADGQLGGDTTDDLGPRMPINPDPATAVAAGDAHTCAIGGDSSVWCWGSNDEGQLGRENNDFPGRPLPVDGLTEAFRLAAGAEHTCAVRNDGSVWCWGSNTSGQLGDGGALLQTKPQLTRLVCR
jgi:alpha-tubulin suppressor-like RCC1 family protein